MHAYLKDEIVGQQFNPDVVLVGVRVGAGGAEGELEEGLEPGRLDAVDVLQELRLAEVEELHDEVPLVQQEVVLHGSETRMEISLPAVKNSTVGIVDMIGGIKLRLKVCVGHFSASKHLKTSQR